MNLLRALREEVGSSDLPPLNKLWVVYAANGRYNGWAVVHANSKLEAKKLMRNADWLIQGRVTGVESFSEYCADVGADCQEEYEIMLAENPQLAQHGGWYEVDWGT